MRFAKPLLAIGIVLEIAAAALGGYAIRLGTDWTQTALAWLVLAMVAAVAGMATIIGGMYMLMKDRPGVLLNLSRALLAFARYCQ